MCTRINKLLTSITSGEPRDEMDQNSFAVEHEEEEVEIRGKMTLPTSELVLIGYDKPWALVEIRNHNTTSHQTCHCMLRSLFQPPRTERPRRAVLSLVKSLRPGPFQTASTALQLSMHGPVRRPWRLVLPVPFHLHIVRRCHLDFLSEKSRSPADVS